LTTGIVKRVPNVKNYGFLVIEEDSAPAEVFFHRTSVVDDGFDTLTPGQKVTFEIQADPRDRTKRRAVQVTPA
jgi:CspA family cold shock protein